jgi:hypothetical protein
LIAVFKMMPFVSQSVNTSFHSESIQNKFAVFEPLQSWRTFKYLSDPQQIIRRLVAILTAFMHCLAPAASRFASFAPRFSSVPVEIGNVILTSFACCG